MKYQDYDGRTPIRYCACGCGVVIGDGDWASGRRHCTKLIPRQHRYTAYSARR